MKKSIVILIIVLLALGNIFFAGTCLLGKVQLKKAQKIVNSQQVNAKTLSFARLFVDKFLSGAKQISFDDRLQLENAVRDTNDQELFNAWQAFTQSTAQDQAQKNLGNLLKLIINKISY